jgi:membrane associated rhomboid family serine protease
MGFLAGVMVAVYICQHWLGVWSTAVETTQGIQTWPWGATSLPALQMGRFWTLVTYVFVHGSLLHLVSNLFPMIHFGRHLFSLLGTGKTLLVFFLSSLGGAALELGTGAVFQRPVSLLGASAGICGLVAAHLSLFPRDMYSFWLLREEIRGDRLLRGFTLFSFAAGAADLFLGWQVFGLPIAHFAHLGGLLVGWSAIRLWRFDGALLEEEAEQLRRKRRQRTGGHLHVTDPPSAISHPAPSPVPPIGQEEQLNLILEKIHRNGMENLTKEERATLEKASREGGKT